MHANFTAKEIGNNFLQKKNDFHYFVARKHLISDLVTSLQIALKLESFSDIQNETFPLSHDLWHFA